MNIAIDHPHHALPVILALSNADKDPVDGLTDSNHPSSSQQSDISSVKVSIYCYISFKTQYVSISLLQ